MSRLSNADFSETKAFQSLPMQFFHVTFQGQLFGAKIKKFCFPCIRLILLKLCSFRNTHINRCLVQILQTIGWMQGKYIFHILAQKKSGFQHYPKKSQWKSTSQILFFCRNRPSKGPNSLTKPQPFDRESRLPNTDNSSQPLSCALKTKLPIKLPQFHVAIHTFQMSTSPKPKHFRVCPSSFSTQIFQAQFFWCWN